MRCKCNPVRPPSNDRNNHTRRPPRWASGCRTRRRTPTGHRPIRAYWESFGVLFDERERFQGIRDVHEIRRLRILLERPLDLRDLGALWKELAVAWNAAPIGFDHRVICRDHLDAVFRLTHRNG